MPSAEKHHVENAEESMLDTQKPQLAANIASVRERRRKGDTRDMFSVTDADKKRYGVKDGWELAWARDPAEWEKHEKKDRVAELSDTLENGGKEAQLVYKNHEFDKVKLGDLVLMQIPPDVAEDDKSFLDDCNKEFERGLRPDKEYEGRSVRSHQDLRADSLDPYDRSDSEMIFDLARAESRANHQTGLIGGNSRTAGMSLPEALRAMSGKEADIERKQEILRMGGQHTALNQEKFTEMLLGGEKAVKSLFGMSGSGFPRNPNSAVAQAARRAKTGER